MSINSPPGRHRILGALALQPMSAPRLTIVLSTSTSLMEQLTVRLWHTGFITPTGMERVNDRRRRARCFSLTDKGRQAFQEIIR